MHGGRKNLVTFRSSDASLVRGDTNHKLDVFVRNRAHHFTRIVSVARGGGTGNGDSFASIIAPHGRRILFASYATNLVRGDTNRRTDDFVRSR